MPLTLDGKSISEIFQEGSSQDIALTVDVSQLATDLDPAQRTVSSLDLHEGLRRLTHNPTTSGPIARIGLIYAGQYQNHPEILGLMFDRGFSTVDDQSTGFQAVPREGSAVFLDSIAAFRKSKSAAVEQETKFTTIHELGHIFNLEHMPGPNFLAVSEEVSPFGADHYKFTSSHQNLLARCSSTQCIQPGGSKYGDRAEIGQSFDPDANNAPVHGLGHSPLRLRLKLTQSSFWYCEPVELEISVSLPRSGASQTIPDAIDPGREEFAIWIQEPSGARRAYRSPKFFCGKARLRKITPGTPFARDLSIFGEAGGYTFHHVGIHRIWATLRISKRVVLVSNAVECELREPSTPFRDFARLRPLLTRAGRLFYYRSARDIAAVQPVIEKIWELAPRSAAAAVSRYALGRAYAEKAVRAARSRRAVHAEKAIQYLARASQSGHLGNHSAARAEQCIAQLKSGSVS